MADLASLFSALQATQQAKSQVRLSERNVIELVNKLKQLGIIGDDLLHTINGKEYITTARLKQEILLALKQAGGRLSLVELPAVLGVDLVHCEKQAAALVAESGGSIQENQGELLTTQFFESVSVEINDMLQESGQLSVAELALQYQINTELLMNILTSNLGTRIQGRLEGGLLYTPAALRRVKAQLRGAMRGAMQPCTLMSIMKDIGLEGFGASNSVISNLLDELVAAGELSGGLKAGGLSWLPAVYTSAQQSALTAFYEQNGWVGYDMARKLGFSAEKAQLAKTFPGGLILQTAYVSPSILAQMQAGVEEALAAGTWVDVSPLVPSVLTAADVASLMEHIPQLKTAVEPAASVKGASKSAAAAADSQAVGAQGAGGPPSVVAGTCVVAGSLVASMQAAAEQLAREGADKALQERKTTAGARGQQQQSAASKTPIKGGRAASDDDDDEDWSTGPKKGKGGKASAKGGASAVKGKGGAKGGGSKQADTGAASAGVGITASQLEDHLTRLYPDMEGAGDGSGLLRQLAKLLLPHAVAAWEAALVAAYTAGAEGRRQAKESLAKALDEAFLRLCLYSSGLELLSPSVSSTPLNSPAEPSSASNSGRMGKSGKGSGASAGKGGGAAAEAADAEDAVYQTMERHVVRAAGGECLDLMFKWVQVEASGSHAEGTSPNTVSASSPPLTPAERAAVARSAPPDMAAALQAASDAVTLTYTKGAISALEGAAEQLGLRLRRPEKKAEKAGVAAVKSQLLAQLVPEQDAAAALTLLVPLLFIKATGRAIQLPGKAISTVLNRIRQDLPLDQLDAVQHFHSQVVDYLKACSGPAGGSAALAEELAGQLPAMKALVGAAQDQ